MTADTDDEQPVSIINETTGKSYLKGDARLKKRLHLCFWVLFMLFFLILSAAKFYLQYSPYWYESQNHWTSLPCLLVTNVGFIEVMTGWVCVVERSWEWRRWTRMPAVTGVKGVSMCSRRSARSAREHMDRCIKLGIKTQVMWTASIWRSDSWCMMLTCKRLGYSIQGVGLCPG